MGKSCAAERKVHKIAPGQHLTEGRWLLRKLVNYRLQILTVLLLGLLGTGMSLVSSVASKYLIDAVTGQSVARIWYIAALLVGMTLGGLLLQSVSSWVSSRVHVRIRNAMQLTAYRKILGAQWESLEPYRSGDLLDRLNSDIGVVSDGIIGFLPSLFTSGVKLVGAFCIMLFYDPVMAVIALAGAPVTLVFSRFFMKKMRGYNLRVRQLSGEVMSFQEDSFRNLTSIKAFSASERYSRELQAHQKEMENATLSFHGFRIRVSACMSAVSMLVTAACFGWGVYRLWSGDITYGSMTMFLQLANLLRGAFSSLVSLAQQAVSVTTSAGRILAVETLPEEVTCVPDGFAGEQTLSLSLKKVSFRYQNGETVLRDFDFTAGSGETVAITGPSGEGKTTLLRLLLGLVAPSGGSASLLGGGTAYPIQAGTRSAFSYVPQGNSIIAGTVAQNLRLLAPEATEEEMEQALKVACAWEFVSQFPEKLEHPLASDRGISEGQAQRIAIARAILRRAPILLLDEATSGLDVDTERRLMENLLQSGLVKTCILVTHRPGSAQFCNRTYEILHGCVTEVSNGKTDH